MKDDAWVLDLPWIPVRSILFRCYGLDLGIILSNFSRYKLSIRVGHPFIQFDSDTGRVSLAYLVRADLPVGFAFGQVQLSLLAVNWRRHLSKERRKCFFALLLNFL